MKKYLCVLFQAPEKNEERGETEPHSRDLHTELDDNGAVSDDDNVSSRDDGLLVPRSSRKIGSIYFESDLNSESQKPKNFELHGAMKVGKKNKKKSDGGLYNPNHKSPKTVSNKNSKRQKKYPDLLQLHCASNRTSKNSNFKQESENVELKELSSYDGAGRHDLKTVAIQADHLTDTNSNVNGAASQKSRMEPVHKTLDIICFPGDLGVTTECNPSLFDGIRLGMSDESLALCQDSVALDNNFRINHIWMSHSYDDTNKIFSKHVDGSDV